MPTISYAQLAAAGVPGGATALSLVTELAPAGGPHAGVAPARYVVGRDTPTFGYETRFIDGQPAVAVIIDQKQSQLNRVEAAVLQSIRDEHPLLSRVPRVQVCYDGGRVAYTDLELPQRVFDGHILAGTVDGVPVAAHPGYRAVRDSSPADARAVLELSPGSLVLGAFDSTRKTRPGRYRSALVGEIIGVLADQDGGFPRESKRGGARVDPVGASITLTGDELNKIMAGQQQELSPDLIKKIEDAARRRGETTDSSALVGLGFTPPALQGPGVVSCSRIIRTQVLSFAALRQLRFDSGPAGDAACRALLAAYALAGLARANAELVVRANCDLVEAGPTVVKLDARNGAFIALDPPSIEEADELLERALEEAKREADIDWRGQVFQITGDPAIYAAAGEPDGVHPAPAPRPFWRPYLVAGRSH
ncbi:MAG TPA: type I-U CRISPR-associated protein Cas7 [Mycobacterium sp.]|nr:type I-U CRISPR-associated protein Cas7 [Mycobacterium sp.]